MRITRSHVEAKIGIVNGMLGYEEVKYNTVGSVQLYHGSGAYTVHRVVNESHGVSDLMNFGTLREVSEFLAGMIAALRIASENTDR